MAPSVRAFALASAAALSLAGAACAPRTAQPAPAPAPDVYAEAPPPTPELFGGPVESEPMPLGPQPWPAPEALAEAPSPDAPLLGAPEPAQTSTALAEAPPPFAAQNGVDVIGTPALPRDYARGPSASAESSVAAAAPAPRASAAATAAAQPSPSTQAEQAQAAADIGRSPTEVEAQAATDAGAAPAPRLYAMAPIANPGQGASEGGRDPARGLLGAPDSSEPGTLSTSVSPAAPTTNGVPPRAKAAASTRNVAPTTTTAAPRATAPARQRPASPRLRELKREADLDAVRVALAAPVSKASLAGVGALRAGSAGPVSLTLPADLAATLKQAAAGRGLQNLDEGASLAARLQGDGYRIEPATPQTAPLVAGQAPTFNWQVTPEGGRRGALTAALTAQVGQGAGRESLALGDVTAPAAVARPAAGLPARAQWALAILLAALAGMVWWLARKSKLDRPRASRYGDMRLGEPAAAQTS